MTDTTASVSEMIFAAGFLPAKKKGQWVKGDLRIIERRNPCCTGITMPDPAGIPDRHPGAFHRGEFNSYELLRGNSRVTGSTRIEDILASC